MLNKRGQLAIFIIIAVVIVAGIIVYFAVSERVQISEFPAELKPAYDFYLSCVEEKIRSGVDLAGSQGGRIYIDDYVPGSEYAPFSSQLNFLGFPVPYWYYIAGNGAIRENVPTKGDIEDEIGKYVEEGIRECDFSRLEEEGFSVLLGEPEAKISVNSESVNAEIRQNLAVSKEDESSSKNTHKIEVKSKLGKFYGIALKIYNKEMRESFLENYSTDVMRLYAPVDGVEISCSPKVWKTREVVDEIKNGLEANIASIKLTGNYYSLSGENRKYFVVDERTDESVNLIYSKNWPSKIEINGEGVEDELMIAEPIGNQEGLGILGFCYAPYHFVYDISFPVMIQVYNAEEIFQFPVAVIIDKNVPRKGIYSEIDVEEEIDICGFKTQDVQVKVYDSNLRSIDANLSFTCLNQRCNLGESKNGAFIGKVPSCVNGYIEARSSGYEDGKQLFSSNVETGTDVILNREYEVELELRIDGKQLDGTAIVSFVGLDGKTRSVAMPEDKKVKLGEGQYEVKVYVYGNSSVTIPASTKTQCQQVPRGGLFGLLGTTREECFDITLPETKIDYALIGGGKSSEYLLGSELEKGKARIDVAGLPRPNSIEQLQNNFEAFEVQGVEIEFNEK